MSHSALVAASTRNAINRASNAQEEKAIDIGTDGDGASVREAQEMAIDGCQGPIPIVDDKLRWKITMALQSS